MDSFHIGPYMTAVGAGEMLTEVRIPAPPRRRQRPREGRAAGRRLGHRGRFGRGLDRRRHDRRRRHRALRRRSHHDPPDPRRGAVRGKPPSEELFAQAGAIASEDCSPTADGRGPVDYKRHLAGVLTQRALRRARRGRWRRRHDVNVSITVNGEQVPRRRAAPAARPLPARDARPDRHPLGLRHVELRRLRRPVDGQPVKSCTVLAAMCDGHEVRTVESLERTASSTRSSRDSTRCTRCSAGSARPAC